MPELDAVADGCEEVGLLAEEPPPTRAPSEFPPTDDAAASPDLLAALELSVLVGVPLSDDDSLPEPPLEADVDDAGSPLPAADVADVPSVPGEVKPKPPDRPSFLVPLEQLLVCPAAQLWNRPPIAGFFARDRTHWSPLSVPDSCSQHVLSSGWEVVHDTVLAIL